MVPHELRQLADSFFDAYAHNFDLTENEGCGQYMEEFVPYAQRNGYPKVGHLKKRGSATQYNGHAIDAFLYNDPDEDTGLLQSVDIIANAEAKPPYSSSHRPPAKGWSIDSPRYKVEDWIEFIGGDIPDEPNKIEFPSYASLGDDAFFRSTLGRTLAFDYSRAKEYPFNDGVIVWTSRTLHTAFENILVHKMHPQQAMERAMADKRGQWCTILRVPIIPVPVNWVVP